MNTLSYKYSPPCILEAHRWGADQLASCRGVPQVGFFKLRLCMSYNDYWCQHHCRIVVVVRAGHDYCHFHCVCSCHLKVLTRRPAQFTFCYLVEICCCSRVSGMPSVVSVPIYLWKYFSRSRGVMWRSFSLDNFLLFHCSDFRSLLYPKFSSLPPQP